MMRETSDIILEGSRPGVMEGLALGPNVCLARNPSNGDYCCHNSRRQLPHDYRWQYVGAIADGDPDLRLPSRCDIRMSAR